ncbi:hypothetical protein GN958_ATG01420 [Phytophthora infestans]|uniref:MULE transposase domain-containing protein n=1 Tax=Phytophthora infestans TaxID=4787 RepID=A0A8S9VFM5_PHYIN|nr:hypothetical protein GN958_ATG01420 [Phytophthora infestans]
MLRSRTRKARTFGSAPFVVNVSELDMARSLGLLRQDVPIEVTDCSKSNYGVAYQRRENIGIETHGSQKAIQERCKELAQSSGFQLFVKSFSSKANDSGNAKYICKKLNGQQFFDKNTSYDEIECPFAINVHGVDGSWKVTRINFAHNHVMRVGFTEQPPAEGTIARSQLAKRNTTQDLSTLTHLIEAEMLPRYDGKTDKMTGAAIARFLVGKGQKLGPSVISRIKSSIDERLGGDMTDSYQKLESYLRLLAEKNPGSIMKFEKFGNGTFIRACFIPNIGIQVAKRSRRLYGFDGAHLKGEMNQRGFFLVATSKDFNSSILPFAFSLVPVENKEHWIWFLYVWPKRKLQKTCYPFCCLKDM